MTAEAVAELQRRLETCNANAETLDAYYDGAVRLAAIGLSLPPEMRRLTTVVNWPRLVVDSLEERLDVEGFTIAGSATADDRLWEWWLANNMDEESSPAHVEALVQRRCYIAVGHGDADGDPPVITPESPRYMYAEIDPRTRRVRRALRLYDQDPETQQPRAATLYEPDRTSYWVLRDGVWVPDPDLAPIEHRLGVVPVVPMVNRSRLGDRTGRSEMADIMPLTDAACRTLTNLQGAQELLALPQRYILGATEADFVGPDGTARTTWQTYIGRILALGNQDAKVGQLQAADLRNFIDVINEYARLVSALSGLPPHFLGFTSENPASADAIRSSEARLVKRAERRSRAFGEAWAQVMRLAIRIADGPGTVPQIRTEWRDPATPTYAAKADAVTKLYAAGLLPLEAAWEELGYGPERRRRLRDLSGSDPAARFLAQLQELGEAAPAGAAPA